MSVSTGRKVKLLFIATLLHLEKHPRGHEMMQAVQSPRCGGWTSVISSDAQDRTTQRALKSRPISSCPVRGLQPRGSEH